MPNKLQILGYSVCLLFISLGAYLELIVKYEHAPLLIGFGVGTGMLTAIHKRVCRFRQIIQEDPKTYVNRRDQLRMLFIVFFIVSVSFIAGDLIGRDMVRSQIKRCVHSPQSIDENINKDIALTCIIKNVSL